MQSKCYLAATSNKFYVTFAKSFHCLTFEGLSTTIQQPLLCQGSIQKLAFLVQMTFHNRLEPIPMNTHEWNGH